MAQLMVQQTMSRHVAFLRGVNVGGRRVTSPQLCAPFEALGLDEVATFLASGNVSFATYETADLEAPIEAALRSALGLDVDVFVRTAGELAQVVAFEPFPPDVIDTTEGKLQVTFLRNRPDPSAVDAILAHASEQDRLAFRGREWYWLPVAGMSTSALDVKAIERVLGRGTTRTINTVARFHARLTAEPRP